MFEYDKDSLLTCIFAQQNLTCENERSLDIAYASLNVQNGHFWEKFVTFWFLLTFLFDLWQFNLESQCKNSITLSLQYLHIANTIIMIIIK